eukprot:4178521-Amphidinium_carterae.1
MISTSFQAEDIAKKTSLHRKQSVVGNQVACQHVNMSKTKTSKRTTYQYSKSLLYRRKRIGRKGGTQSILRPGALHGVTARTE